MMSAMTLGIRRLEMIVLGRGREDLLCRQRDFGGKQLPQSLNAAGLSELQSSHNLSLMVAGI